MYLGGDRDLQGVASYKLGHAYEQNGDGETALLVSIVNHIILFF